MFKTTNKQLLFIMMKKGYLWVLLLCMFSCENDDDTTPTPSSGDSINGTWFSAEKGYIFEFTEGNDLFYNVNSVGCVLQDDNFVIEDFFGFTLNQTSENELVASSDLSDIDVVFTRLPEQNPFCLSDQIAMTDDPQVNYDHFWNIFNDYYAFFEARNIDWSHFEGLGDIVTNENLYDIIEEVALVLQDGHVSIYDEQLGIEIESGDVRLLERLNTNLSGDLIIEEVQDFYDLGNEKIITIVTDYLGGAFEIDDRENIIWGFIDNDTGYINIITMQGYGTDFNNELSSLNTLLDTIMEDLAAAGISKLVLDLRFNEGGIDTVALDIASRFMDQERLSYFKKARLGDTFTENTAFSIEPKGNFQFTEDIVILTSPITVSAGELFTLCLKDQPYVTIVGENTAGAFSTILNHTLPNGAEIGLSNEIYTDAQGTVFEIVGIGPSDPENQIPFFSTSDFEEGIDSGIDRALEVLEN
ncbi:S41 family peptidase [uncultured Dokdonia sp.]|uniref:S41 family peptidase n=2 Tax=uncultured Dokdonia sp. TaxID=575653 RepID=UPI0026213FBC|nr:S41 family peptidase [uncultured Dokdonia sp.]